MLLDNDAGGWTTPSPDQYPHQWSWDSAFVSLGWATFDWDRAVAEIESLLAARWREGMVPHVRYDPARLEGYFPGPERWPRAQRHVASSTELTSGICNPPVVVSAALLVGRRQPDRERRLAFWRRAYAGLRGFVEYLATRRALPGSPLIAVVHPWESGMDNSPRWDHLFQAGLRPSHPYVREDLVHVAAGDRPTDAEYDAYIALIELLEAADYEVAAYRRQSPFCMYDVFMDAAWYRAALDLGEIAGELGEPRPVSQERLEGFASAFEATHWDPELGFYVDWDCVGGRRVPRPTCAGLAALFGGLTAPDRAVATWARYRRLERSARSVCSVPPSDPAFDRRRYWRGPVWVHVNWLVAEGLARCDLGAEAAALRGQTLDFVRQSGFAEYFDPRSGAPCGAGRFAWTAALTLDLLARPRD